MKKILLLLPAVILLASMTLIQTKSKEKIPAVNVKTLDGTTFNTGKLSNNGKPMIISFWATWCKPCKRELDAIADEYPDWQKETGVKLVAISIDDSRSANKVATEVREKGWTYDVYIDENQDFKRAMHVNNVPDVFLVDGKGNIVYQHNSYSEGDEEKLYELVKKLAKGQKISE